MNRENEHYTWEPTQLRENLVGELCRRMALIFHWHEIGEQSQMHACLGRLAFQLKTIGRLDELSSEIASALLKESPSESHLRLAQFISGNMTAPAPEVDVAGEPIEHSAENDFLRAMQILAKDVGWDTLSASEKRERFRALGLPVSQPGEGES